MLAAAMARGPGLLLLRDADVFAPASIGRRDVLVGGGRVLAIEPRLDALPASLGVEVVDCAGARLVPGLVDAHVHVTGGGGEAGYASRVPPLPLSDLSRAGVTSVVGLLGTDGTTRTMRELVARTYALREEGLSAWCWTGNYEVPVKTLTGSIRDDIAFVEPIIGVGELAVSDHRSSQPTLDELLRIAAHVHVGGMMTGKAGVVHLHLGDGARGLDLVRRAIAGSELPARVFHPTHVNRNPALWNEARELARDGAGPMIDLTAFAPGDVGHGIPAAAAIAQWVGEGLPLARLTCSSDGGGCMPSFDADGRIVAFGVGQPSTLLATLRAATLEHGLGLAEVLPVLTCNVADLLRLAGKGRIAVGADADLVVLGADVSAQTTIAGGRVLVRDGQAVARGHFESRAG
jgi:beta-aspartyl-dipeptidase (metallo-type)